MHSNTIPWKEILISGFILDPDRKKMSKSKGNVVTPQHLIDNYGADPIRYWASRARLGIDTALDEQVMVQGKKLVNKIFNASKFVFSMVENSPLKGASEYESHITNPMDKSWLYKMDSMMKQASSNFETYDYASALEGIEKRFLDFCDYYLEIVKKRAYSETDTSAVASLMKTIDTFLKAFAPFCPFITEEVYQCRPWGNKEGSIHGTAWPKAGEFEGLVAKDSALYDNASVIISEIRKAKTTANTSQRTAVSKVVISAPVELQEVLKEGLEDIINVGNLNPDALEFNEAKELLVGEIVLDLKAVV
jgi:valyl-tRNA synthetase